MEGLIILGVIGLMIGLIVVAQLWSKKRDEAESVQAEQRWIAACNDPEVIRAVDDLSAERLRSIETPSLSLQRSEFCYYTTGVEHHEPTSGSWLSVRSCIFPEDVETGKDVGQ